MTGRPLGNASFSEPGRHGGFRLAELAQRGGFHGGDSLPILKGPPGSPPRLHDEEDSVPLSEHEQRMLEQMERALYAEDPKFATALEGSGLRTYTRRRVYQAVAGFLVGIALLMAGMVAKQIWLSVVGFLVMLGCAVLAVTGWRKAPKPGEQPARAAAGARTRRRQATAAALDDGPHRAALAAPPRRAGPRSTSPTSSIEGVTTRTGGHPLTSRPEDALTRRRRQPLCCPGRRTSVDQRSAAAGLEGRPAVRDSPTPRGRPTRGATTARSPGASRRRCDRSAARSRCTSSASPAHRLRLGRVQHLLHRTRHPVHRLGGGRIQLPEPHDAGGRLARGQRVVRRDAVVPGRVGEFAPDGQDMARGDLGGVSRVGLDLQGRHLDVAGGTRVGPSRRAALRVSRMPDAECWADVSRTERRRSATASAAAAPRPRGAPSRAQPAISVPGEAVVARRGGSQRERRRAGLELLLLRRAARARRRRRGGATSPPTARAAGHVGTAVARRVRLRVRRAPCRGSGSARSGSSPRPRSTARARRARPAAPPTSSRPPAAVPGVKPTATRAGMPSVRAIAAIAKEKWTQKPSFCFRNRAIACGPLPACTWVLYVKPPFEREVVLELDRLLVVVRRALGDLAGGPAPPPRAASPAPWCTRAAEPRAAPGRRASCCGRRLHDRGS